MIITDIKGLTNEELLVKIDELSYWVIGLCREACERAGLEDEWADAGAEDFEDIVYRAMDILAEATK